MPDAIERIDDRTFFILYALTKHTVLYIPALSMLYGERFFRDIFRDFNFLNDFDIEIELTYAPACNLDIEKLKQINEYEVEILEFIEQKRRCSEISLIAQKLVPYAMAGEFICKHPETLIEKIDAYLMQSEKSRSLNFYNIEKHLKVFEEVKKWAITGMSAPYKIGFDRFLEYITETNKTKYSFFHFLYQLEKSHIIKISELSFQERYPLIIFDNWKQKIHNSAQKNAPRGRELASFETLHLYENGICDTAQRNEFFQCDNIEVTIFKIFFNQPYQEKSYGFIATALSLTENDIPKRISKARRKLRKISGRSGKVYFINNQKNKTYKFINNENN